MPKVLLKSFTIFLDLYRRGIFLFKNAILNAFRENRIPAIILQCLAFFIIYAYFYLPSTAPFFEALASLKDRYGLLYSVLATALFGGFIPYVYLLVTGRIQEQLIAQCLFYIGLWAIMGLVVDRFYWLQGVWFGNEATFWVVVKKTCVDMFLFSAFLTCPFLTLAYVWRDNRFSWSQLWQACDKELFYFSIPVTVVTNWMIWIPAVAVIYSMPANLQIPLFNVVLCFFVLLLTLLQRDANIES